MMEFSRRNIYSSSRSTRRKFYSNQFTKKGKLWVWQSSDSSVMIYYTITPGAFDALSGNLFKLIDTDILTEIVNYTLCKKMW